MMQNAHGRSQPSAILTYALWPRADADARRVVIVDVRGRLGDLDDRQASCAASAPPARALEHLRDRLEVRRAEDVIDLGDVLGELVGVALREAAGDDELLRPGLLVLRHLEDGVDALFLGGVDERAGVDDDDVGALGRVDQRVAGGLDLAEHQLGVDLVLRTAERHEVDALSEQAAGQSGPGHRTLSTRSGGHPATDTRHARATIKAGDADGRRTASITSRLAVQPGERREHAHRGAPRHALDRQHRRAPRRVARSRG